MKTLGTILVGFGLFLCITIIGLPWGVLLVVVGAFLLVAHKYLTSGP
jgi:hypothetical protein